ncbi:response regulator [Pseudomarimonas salicorniae]|uniref:Response regulator transcription factor n=1 Tax=Pseudomarimonas salicorniae TaxID=2933270 RepID=A0ABT0GIP1_9GAMM|nr:response regulator transcription factor [Lysobacter sp. CAU 1642]
MENAPVRVVLADDHVLVRSGLRALVEQVPGYEVVGEAGDGEALLEAVEAHHPDLAIVDIQMPHLGGIDALDRIKRGDSPPKVLILSMHSADDYVLRAMRSGADGYLLKDAAASELGRALAALQRGERYLSPKVSETLANVSHRLDEAPPSLSPRQREVLRLIARGRATKEIAFELGLSPKTVESHRAQIMERLGIRDIAGLVRYALRNGLIHDDD